jgi:16S rRNA (guanine(966)-N(2))-methyltransferase RsmD
MRKMVQGKATHLRVVAGRYRRRRLRTLPGEETRPMLDRMRETLFNVLQGQVEGKSFADLYAGTGAVGIEALSRGVRRVTFVETNPAAVEVIRANLNSLGAQDDARIVFSPVAGAVRGLEADVVFLGPPYRAHDEYENTLTTLGDSGPALVIAQHDRAHRLSDRYGRLEKFRTIEMGRNALSFFRSEEPQGPAS